MKVKIIKSKKDTMWYANKIGEEYEVSVYRNIPIIYLNDFYKVKQLSKYVPSFIYIEDCQLL